MSDDSLQYVEAERLVNSGDWIFQDDIWPQIEQAVLSKLDTVFAADKSLIDRVLVPTPIYSMNWETGKPEKTGTQRILPNFYSTLHRLRDDVESTNECKQYEAPPESVSYDLRFSEMRVWGGTIFKIGPTFNKSKWAALGIIGAVLAIAKWDVLILIATLASTAGHIRDVVSNLRSGWERLNDPREYLVFEKLFTLQGKLSVTNYDALAKGDYDNVYGYLAPSMRDIEDAIASHVPKEELPEQWRESSPETWRDDLHKIMNELKERNILKEHSGRWSIVF